MKSISKKKFFFFFLFFLLFSQKTLGVDNGSFENGLTNWKFLKFDEPQNNLISQLKYNNREFFSKILKEKEIQNPNNFEIIEKRENYEENFFFLKNYPSDGNLFLRMKTKLKSGNLIFQTIKIKKNFFYELSFDAKINYGRNVPIIFILDKDLSLVEYFHSNPDIYQKGWIRSKFSFKSTSDISHIVIVNTFDQGNRTGISSVDFDNIFIREVNKLKSKNIKSIELNQYLDKNHLNFYEKLLDQIKIPIIKLRFSEKKIFDQIDYKINETNHYFFKAININKNNYTKAKLNYKNFEYDAKIRLKGDTAVHLYSPIKSLRINLKNNYLFGLKRISLNRLEARGLVTEIFSNNILKNLKMVSGKNKYVFVLINDYPVGIMLLSEQLSKDTLERNGEPISNLYVENNSLKNDQATEAEKMDLIFKKYYAREKREMKKSSVADDSKKWDVSDYYFYSDLLKFNELNKFLDLTNIDNLIQWNSMNILFGSAHQDSFHNMKTLMNSKTGKFEQLFWDHHGRFALPRFKFKEYQLWYDKSYKGFDNPYLSFAFKNKIIFEDRNQFLWSLLNNEKLDQMLFYELDKLLDIIKLNYSLTPQYTYNGNNLINKKEFLQEFSKIKISYKKYLSNLKKDLSDNNDEVYVLISKNQNGIYNLGIKRIKNNSTNNDFSSFGLEIYSEEDKIQEKINKMLSSLNSSYIDKKSNNIIIPSSFYVETYLNSPRVFYSEKEFSLLKKKYLLNSNQIKYLNEAYAKNKNGYFLLDRNKVKKVFNTSVPNNYLNIPLKNFDTVDLKKIKFKLINNTTRVNYSKKLNQEINLNTITNIENRFFIYEDKLDNKAYFSEKYPKYSNYFQENLIVPESFEIYGKKIIVPRLKHRITENIYIPKGYSVTILPGAELNFINTSFVSLSPVNCKGTPSERIIFKSSVKKWGSFVILNAQKNSLISNSDFEYGNSTKANGIKFLGMVSVYNSDVEINNSKFSFASKNSGDDSINLVNSKFLLKNSIIEKNFKDGLDSDFSKKNSFIIDTKFIENLNDGLDISQSDNLQINNIFASRNGDKGLSVGEQSNTTIKNSVFEQNDSGIAIKDQSEVKLVNSSINNNRLGLISYSKKKFFFKSNINLKFVDIFENKYNFGFQDKFLSKENKKIYKTEIRSDRKYKTTNESFNYIVNEGLSFKDISKKKFYKIIVKDELDKFKPKKTVLKNHLN